MDKNDKIIDQSDQFEERLTAIKADESVTSISIDISLYGKGKVTEVIVENVKREYRKFATQKSGLSKDKITVNGTITQITDTNSSNNSFNKSSVTVTKN
ncbi:hypothetical protein [Ferruginibacter profundus]